MLMQLIVPVLITDPVVMPTSLTAGVGKRRRRAAAQEERRNRE